MALADTAKLVASLELQDKFSKPLGNANTALGNAERKFGTLGKIGGQVSQGFQSAATNLTRIGIAGAGLLTAAVTAGVQSLERLETANAQTAAVLKSTDNVAGQTADGIRALSEKFEGLNATLDDTTIQSGANLLLTFTNIRKDAFEPALQAALDMNQAMGGGEEGLQNTIIQIGKALQDPIKGAGSLRRVGVALTKQQQEQIKTLVEQNDLYGAQQIILGELTTEFGGSFAAAGDTAAGKFARVKDAVEDAQRSLATAFLPVLEKVADKLGTFLADPATVKRIEDFGGQLAAGFDTVLEKVGQLDFGAIGSALTIAGTGAKAVFDAFTGLPPWIQTAVLTGWGLNKLTGGALTGIAGTLGKALLGSAFGGRGSTPANPLFVSAVGGVGGPGGAVVGGGGSLVGNLVKAGLFVGIATAIGELVAQNVTRPTNPTQFDFNQIAGASGDFTRQQGAEDFAIKLADQLDIPLTEVKQRIVDAVNNQGLTFDQAVSELKSIKNASHLDALRAIAVQTERQAAQSTEAARQLDTLRSQASSLIRLNEKKFDPTVNVNVAATANISVSNVTRTLTSFRIAGSTTLGGFTESAF